jgi:mannose-6-phosphate isomerase-like protein (cupin superfamily)
VATELSSADIEGSKMRPPQLIFLLIFTCVVTPETASAAPQMVVIDERRVMVQEPPPHGKIGMSTAYRISDQVPNRMMEFRKRVLHPGAAIGEHVIAHDEVYYVLSGEGEVVSDGKRARLKAGSAAYLYTGANVGIWQKGKAPLVLIISYPVVK